MSLASIVRSGVALADRLTASLHVQVVHYTRTSTDGYGKPEYDGGTARMAIVESVAANLRTTAGDVITPKTKVTFPRPVAVSNLDKIVLPDGTTGPILDIVGLVDPATNAVYMVEVLLG